VAHPTAPTVIPLAPRASWSCITGVAFPVVTYKPGPTSAEAFSGVAPAQVQSGVVTPSVLQQMNA
jgi:hypothetical protein